MDRLPHTALLNSDPAARGREPWTDLHELSARILEEVSAVVARRVRKEPLVVERPPWVAVLRRGRAMTAIERRRALMDAEAAAGPARAGPVAPVAPQAWKAQMRATSGRVIVTR